ncbi:MAG: AAA family ATPase [Acidimicrobiia bacterium]|nr:AAA family ATPase [Acidimicrobiia bacterium]
MRLVKAQVTDFQSIQDSTEFEVGDVTCLVGKNEAGKTALLKAIYRLNPVNESDANFDMVSDYPRATFASYEAEIEDAERDHANVIRATFQLEALDVAAVSERYGTECLARDTPTFTLCKGYGNTVIVSDLDVNEIAVLDHLTRNANLPTSVELALLESDSLEAKIGHLDEVEESTESTNNLRHELSEIKDRGLETHMYEQILRSRVPQFLYFDEYYQLTGHDNIEALQQRVHEGRLKDSDQPLLGLIELAGLNLDTLTAPRRTEALLARLEAAESELTGRVLTYWSQNRHLRLIFDVRPAQPEDPPGMTAGTNVLGRVRDTKHSVTTPLGSRSRGFVWFFSFLAWYSKVRRENDNLILLLDEPGLSLHAKAQGDLLAYFEAELAPNHQVLYTTHSPFMVDPSKFHRARIVQDRSIEENSENLTPDQEGTKVTTDVLEATKDSLFPLQAALGWEIHQTLFIGPNCLVVEGVSDLLYIQAISEKLQSDGREGLSADWTITPVGGFDKVSTFVALIGAQSGIKLATLVDYHRKDQQAIENLFKRKLMQKSNVLTFADFVDGDEADVEDMFDPGFYLKLVKKEFGTSIKVADLSGSPRFRSE